MKTNLTSQRKQLKKIYAPFGKLFGKLGLSPNLMTLISLILGLAAAYSYFYAKIIPALILILISGLFDLWDGVIAVEFNKATKFGSVFDWMADKAVDAFVLGAVGLAFAGPLIALLAVTSSLLHSFIKPTVYCEIGSVKKAQGKINDPLEGVGIFGRPETVITLIFFSILHLFSIPYLNLATGIVIIASLSTISLLIRIFYLYRKYRKVSDL